MNSYALWNSYMKCYDFLTNVDGYRQNMRDIVNAADVWLGSRVLDAGSGTGNLSILLKERHAEVVSCDFCESAIRAHKQKDPEARIVHASLEQKLPFDDCCFERVCCASVLFALSRSGCSIALSEFFRVLVPGGRLVITVPTGEASLGRLTVMHWKTLRLKRGWLNAVIKFLLDAPALLKVIYYNKKLRELPDWSGFHRFTAEELRAFVSLAGFERISVSRTYGGVFLLLTAEKAVTAH